MSLFQRHADSLLQGTPVADNGIDLLDQVNALEEDKIHISVRECFNSLWKSELQSFTKADTFRLFKDSVKFERYLDDIKIRKHRVSFAKFRVSDHCLMIEKGRHIRPVLSRESRFCPHCPLTVETEEHFLTECPPYNRTTFFTEISAKAPQFANLDSHSKFIFLMSQEDRELTGELAVKVHRWLNSRREFEDQQKELDNVLAAIDLAPQMP
jgi:hypothetical protein